MGTIRIEINGSFLDGDGELADLRRKGPASFPAMDHGHAAALGEAIAHLASLMPAAVRLDHQLHAEGSTPNDRFGLAADPS